MAKQPARIRIYALAWFAFLASGCFVFALILAWPWLRSVPAEQSAYFFVSTTGVLFWTSIAVGLTVRDIVLKRYGQAKQTSKTKRAHRVFSNLLIWPASFVAFFSTCAPLGLLSAAEGTVQPSEKNWSNEIWIAAWILGCIAAVVVGALRREHQEVGLDQQS